MAHNATAQTQEQINAGLQLANERFNEQLQELRQLPFILKAKEIELQETMSKLKIAEKTINALSNDLEGCIVKCEFLTKDLEQEKKFNCDARLQIDTLKSTSIYLLILIYYLFVITSFWFQYTVIITKYLQL